MIKTFTFVVNGFTRHCQYSESTIKTVFMPIVEDLAERQRRTGRRIIVFLAAPPAVGKTTLSLLFEALSANHSPIQALSLDGFHYPQAYLAAHTITIEGKTIPLSAVKGSPETYDIIKLKEKLAALKNSAVEWPIYDRTLHDVSDQTILADKDILLIEGNWLLLDEQPWRELRDDADYTIFITAEEATLKPRLIERKMLGGLSQADAEKFYETSDRANIYRVLNRKLPADIAMTMTTDGDYLKGATTP